MKTLLTCLVLAGFGLAMPAMGQERDTLRATDLFGDMRARHIGPALMSGRINDLEVHPTNQRILYVGSAGGGVWKSADAGTTFAPVFDEHCQSIGVVTLDPSDPDNTIYVGTGETWTRNSVSVGCGLFRSRDGGTTWESLGFENSERIASVIVHPENPEVIYVGVLGALWGDSEERGVYKSSDGGKSWERILYLNPRNGLADMAMDPSNPDILYASMWEFRRTAWSFESGGGSSALFKTTDGGRTWNKIHNGFPEGQLGRLAIAVAPTAPNVLYTVIEAEQPERKGLYRSDDGGRNWQQLNNDFGITVRPFYFSRIVTDPRNPDVVVKAGLSGSISRDGGKTFKNLGNMHSDIHDIAFSIVDSDIVYVATDGGLYRSWDGGNTLEINEDLPLSQFYHVSVDNADPYNVYGGLQDNGSWYGPSSSPGGITARDWNSVGGGDGFRVLKHPTKPVIYSEMQGAESVWRYDTEKQLLKTIQPQPTADTEELRFNWNAPMALSPHQPDRFYMGSQYLHRSEDMGDTWEVISPDLTTNDPEKQGQEDSGGLSMDNSGAENHTTIFTIAESPLDEKVIWVGTDDGNVQLTRDGGQTWTNTSGNIPGLPANTWVYHIEPSVHDKGTAYAVFDGHTRGDMTPYAFRTTDFGASWTSIITGEVDGFARSLQEDYENPDLLFLGTEFGLFITLDGGLSWTPFRNNMPPVAVHYLELHKATNDLVMGTHGRGVIILDDISPLRELNRDVMQATLHFFKSPPTVIDETSNFGSSTVSTEFVGANRSTQAQIRYFLKSRHTFGKMSMEIRDAEGNTITTLEPGKQKGLNVVDWGYRRKPPKVAKGKTFSFGGFTAPRVPAGTYTAVITKGRETFEHPFELVYDTRSGLSQAQREQKYQTTMELYDMTQELAYLVYQVDAYQEQAEKAGDRRNQKKLQELKETLVVTTGDNYVGLAAPQLREKMADLYSKVAGAYDVPSAADLDNLALIRDRFEKAKSDFEAIKPRVKGGDTLQLASFEAFLEMD
jgi:photosystem II stability/assembly factor-like uncharacterized protein